MAFHVSPTIATLSRPSYGSLSNRKIMFPKHRYRVLLFLCISCQQYLGVSSKIFSHSDDDRVIKLTSGRLSLQRSGDAHRYRERREEGGGATSSELGVHEFHLPDADHNEAIVHWSGKNSTTMFILTRKHSYNDTVTDSKLWRSTDYGSSFTEVKLPDVNAIISFYYACPNNKNMMLFTDVTHKKLYRTTDEGASFQNITFVPIRPDVIRFHPKDQNSFLVYSMEQQQLQVTLDFGSSWKQVGDFVNPRFYWAVPGIDADNYTVHMEVQDLATGEFQYRAVKRPYPTEVSLGEGIGNIDIDSLLVQNEYIFVQKSGLFYSHLYVSHKRGPLLRAYFPNDLQPQDFSIVNADEHQVFIAANYRSQAVHLYLSDTTGRFYTDSLSSLMALHHSEGGFTADLYEVRGLRGTFLANYYKREKEPATVITFDQGGRWQPVLPPSVGPDGKPTVPCNAAQNCSLQLHILLSAYRYDIPPILSEENAPGMILAQGHAGEKLEPLNSDLYFSSDGGYSWKYLLKGNYGKTIIDQGGAMVLVQKDTHSDSKEVFYSCDEWATSQTYTYSTGPLRVDGILNDPGITSRVVSVFGHSEGGSGWTVIKLDFSNILSRQCSPADYIEWSPRFGHGWDCSLGLNLTYVRRKPASKCYIGGNHEHSITNNTCTCHQQDFECDYGYESRDDKCTAADWFNHNVPIDDCHEGFFNQSSGYRKVASDKCSGGDLVDKYKPTKVKCPVVAPTGLLLISSSHPTGVLQSNVMATFQLLQTHQGSIQSTNYTWSFGDGTNTTLSGNGSHNQNHKYQLRGVYVVTVTATNSNGSASAVMDVMVEDRLLGIFITATHAAKAGSMVTLVATLFSKSSPVASFSQVHYVWSFGDDSDEFGSAPLLTWDRQVDHSYLEAGNYSGYVQANNNLGTVFRKFTVVVYNVVRTYTLGFEEVLQKLHQNTLAWRELFGQVLKNTLIETLEVDGLRLEVVVLEGEPLVADVSILPVSHLASKDDSLDEISTNLVKMVMDRKLVVELGREDFGYHVNVTVVSAVQVTDGNKIKKSYTAVYICVPILLLAVFIAGLIIYYYKRKLSSMTRYSLLRSQRSPVTDALLEDTDDDDPPLDPNPDHQRLALSDDDLADDPLGANLMMAAPGSAGTRSNTVNC